MENSKLTFYMVELCALIYLCVFFDYNVPIDVTFLKKSSGFFMRLSRQCQLRLERNHVRTLCWKIKVIIF